MKRLNFGGYLDTKLLAHIDLTLASLKLNTKIYHLSDFVFDNIGLWEIFFTNEFLREV